MPSTKELSDTVHAVLTLGNLDAATIERSPSSTIVPSSLRVDTAGEQAVDALSQIAGATLERKLELHGTLGEGGMGIVRLATQRALGREVAVKALRPEHRNDRSVLKLLREAWVTGRLEHPNVVPVYDIAVESDGMPLIVLKKIEGVDWGTLMHDAPTVRERFGADDLLEWNLRILMQLCNAVRFAHSRRVLHRDLKPENVMIGQFGEVYLVDWGIAVSLDEDRKSHLPLASEAREMAGTPLYMAPEMLGGPVSRLSERTDVYLLGAILYEIVAGEPPHRGKALMEIVASIIASDPPIPDDVPEELATIVRRAIDPDPDARFENAEQVRLALQAFLQHREAARLAERAEERMGELLSLLASGASEPEDREAIYHLFGECRFGFRQALEAWPDNESARVGLDRAAHAMVEYELGQGEPDAAHALLREMASVPSALAERVADARAKRAKEDAELRRISDDLDASKGRRTRNFLWTVLGVGWTLTPLGAQLAFDRLGTPSPTILSVAVSAAFFIVVFLLAVWARESMTRTAINRRLSLAGILAMGLLLVAKLASMKTGQPLTELFHSQLLVAAAIMTMLASAVDWRLLVAAGGYVLGYITAALVGVENTLYVLSACNVVLLLNGLFLWFRPKEDFLSVREGIERRRARRRDWLAARKARRTIKS